VGWLHRLNYETSRRNRDRASSAQSRDTARLNQVRGRLIASQRRIAAQRRALADQREINGQLQRALLPEAVPSKDVNGMRVAVRYFGADREVNVGGDWYLSDAMPGGDVVLAVGDVVGHGLAAASTMVQLRHATTALAFAGLAPGEILSSLNRMLARHGGDAAATAIVARYNPRTHVLTWARAGHPPMLWAHGDAVEPLWDPAGIMLGAVGHATYTQGTHHLAPEDLLLMYTDGFVEGAGDSIDRGIRVLGDHARRALHLEVDDRPGLLVDRLRRRNPLDDACALAAAPIA
jgi:serine phosphatase RsbU (regulator of sigma subunit)